MARDNVTQHQVEGLTPEQWKEYQRLQKQVQDHWGYFPAEYPKEVREQVILKAVKGKIR